MDFAAFLQPLLPGDFLQDHWEKSVCVVQREDRNYYSHFCSIADLDSLINVMSDSSSPSKVRLAKAVEGKLNTRAVLSTSEGVINAYHIYRACFEDKYTISIDRVDLKWKPVAELCRQLEATLQHTVAANLYFTPPDAQGFLPHFDTHDVFIVQVAGSKIWRIYDSPTRLPMIENTSPLPAGPPSPPIHTFRLNQGDLLYLPRGFVHDTYTEEESSLHITVGVHVFRWADLISEALTAAAEGQVEFREALPPGFLGDDCRQQLGNKLRELLQHLSLTANSETAVRRLEDRILTNGQPVPDGHFVSMGRHIDLNTVVKRRTGMICKVRLHEDRVTIHFPGNIISGPKAIEPALQFIGQSEQFTVSDLPDCLEDEDKVILTQRLVREGLLTVAG